ncbi:MAG: SIS domain-containing protein [Planctomycetes bacterium]|nr:SIS domain-containing protein [Planctomycetota bacterium]
MLNTVRALAEAASSAVLAMDPSEPAALVSGLVGARRIFFVGAGRTGLVARGFVIRLRQLDLEAYMAGESATPRPNANDIVVVCSGSMRTPSILAIYKRMAASRVPIIVITAAGSNITQGKILHIPLDERARAAPLGTVFELALQLLLDGIVPELMSRLKRDEKSMAHWHTTLE